MVWMISPLERGALMDQVCQAQNLESKSVSEFVGKGGSDCPMFDTADHLREILGGLGFSDDEADDEYIFEPDHATVQYLSLDRLCCLQCLLFVCFSNRPS